VQAQALTVVAHGGRLYSIRLVHCMTDCPSSRAVTVFKTKTETKTAFFPQNRQEPKARFVWRQMNSFLSLDNRQDFRGALKFG